MKDDKYFGFSTNDDFDDFKVVNLPDDDREDDFKLVELVDFDTEDDVRIVCLSDASTFSNSASEQDARWCSIDHIDHMKRKTPALPSSSGLKTRCSRKQRIIKSVIVAALVVAVLLAFVSNSLMGSRTGVQTSTASASRSASIAPIMAPPANAAPLIIDANHYYIQLNPNWAQILLDGHSLKHFPVPGVDPPLRIPAGQHLITWRTNDQQIYSCTMSVPPSLMDTCVYNGPEPLQNGVSVWIIAIPHFDDAAS
jgi:hypothetical protein